MSRGIPGNGLTVSFPSPDQLLTDIVRSAVARDRTVRTYINVDTCNAATDSAVSSVFNELDTWCDGFGVLYAARALGTTGGSRVTMPDIFHQLLDELSRHNCSVFFLGHRAEVVELALTAIRDQHPLLDVDGHHGYFRNEHPEEKVVVDLIRARAPSVLFLGMGQPLQEKFALRNKSSLGAGSIVCIGAVLDYEVGMQRRPPAWMTDNGLEWFGRLLSDPKRLWVRYVVGLPKFATRVLLEFAERRLLR